MSILFLRVVYFFKSMINNPEFRQFILQVQSGVIYYLILIIILETRLSKTFPNFTLLCQAQTDMEKDAPRF